MFAILFPPESLVRFLGIGNKANAGGSLQDAGPGEKKRSQQGHRSHFGRVFG